MGESKVENRMDQYFSLRDFYYVLFRHKMSIFTILFSASIITIIGVFIMPEMYESKAAVLIKMGRENVTMAMPPTSQQPVVTSLGLRKEDINSEIEILENRYIIEKVVKKIGIDFLFPKTTQPKGFFKQKKYQIKQIFKKIRNELNNILFKLELKKKIPPYERAVLAVQQNISVKQVSNSDVIEIRFGWHDPVIATKVLDTLLDFYLEHHSDAHKISGGHEFFQNQVELIGEQLRDSENRLQRLKRGQKITSFEEQNRLLLMQLADFRASLLKTQTDIAETATKINALERQMSDLIEAITPGFDLAYKELEKEFLLQKVNLKALNSRKEELEEHIESYRKDLEILNANDMTLIRLDRQIRFNEENYDLYRKKLEETRISDILDNKRIINVRVIAPAFSSFTPVSPNRLLIIGFGAIISLIFSIGFAFLKEYVNHSFNTAEDVKKYLDLPVLASIKEMKK